MINRALTPSGNTELSLHHDEKRHRKCKSEGGAVDLSVSASGKHVMWDESGIEHYIASNSNLKSSRDGMREELERPVPTEAHENGSGVSPCASDKDLAYDDTKLKPNFITAEEAARRRHVMFVQHRKKHCYHEYDQVKQFRRQSEEENFMNL